MKVAKTFLPVDDFMQDTAVSKSRERVLCLLGKFP